MDRSEAATRIKAWTRGRFGDVTVFVSELAGGSPGFPPKRTVIAFWNAERKHYHFTVFKALADVSQDDIPPSWFKDALAVTPGIDCSCC